MLSYGASRLRQCEEELIYTTHQFFSPGMRWKCEVVSQPKERCSTCCFYFQLFAMEHCVAMTTLRFHYVVPAGLWSHRWYQLVSMVLPLEQRVSID